MSYWEDPDNWSAEMENEEMIRALLAKKLRERGVVNAAGGQPGIGTYLGGDAVRKDKPRPGMYVPEWANYGGARRLADDFERDMETAASAGGPIMPGDEIEYTGDWTRSNWARAKAKIMAHLDRYGVPPEEVDDILGDVLSYND